MKQCSTLFASCEALAGQRYNVFGRLIVEPKDISTTSVRDFDLFIRGAGLLNLCWSGLYNKPKAAMYPEHKLTGKKKKKKKKKKKEQEEE